MPNHNFTDAVPMGNGGDASQVEPPAMDFDEPIENVASGKKDRLARGMDSAAASLHERAEALPGGPKVARAAHATAGAMETAADYVRDREVKEMLSDVQQAARKHPGVTLLAATAVGFLLARLMSRN